MSEPDGEGRVQRGQWETYLGHRVRIYSGADWKREGEPCAEGEVIAVCTVPTLVIRHADNTTSHHASTLPIEVMEWRAL